MREPCLLPCLGLIAGLATARLWPYPPGWPETLLGAVCLGLSFQARLSGWLRSSAVMLAFAALGCWLPWLRTEPAPPPLPGEGLVAIEGCVVEPAVHFEGRTRFTIELSPGVRAQISHYPKSGAGPELEAGQAVAIEARLRRPDRFRNPGAFDYPAYLAQRDVHFLGTVPANRAIAVTGACGSAFLRAVAGSRRFLLRRIEQLHADRPETAGLMQALLLGESKKVRREWTEEFRQTGTYHALVVSGQHVVVLTGLVLLAGRLLLPRFAALGLAAVVAWIYALLAGGSAPVVRSAAGLSLFLFASYLHRRGRLLNILAVVAMVFLLLEPGQLFDASFQLSFLAVAAIGGLAEPLIGRYIDPWRTAARAPQSPEPSADPRVEAIRIEWRLLAITARAWLRIPDAWTLRSLSGGALVAAVAVESLLLSALVQAALALPGILYFHRFSFTGLTANLAIGPLLGAAIPIGFLATLSGSPWLAWVTSALMDASVWLARAHARWEPQWRIPDPPVWLAAAALATGLAAAWALRARRVRVMAFALWLAVLTLMLWHPFRPDVRLGTLELTAVDVGQGDGLLLGLPDGSLAAVDAGGFPAMGNDPQHARRPDLDLGEDVLAPYFWTRSIQRLDVLVLTHAHADHIGGALALLRNFTPREIWTGLMPETEPAWAEIVAQARARSIRIRQPRAGEEWSFGGARFRALAPFAGDAPGPRAHNNDSLVFTVAHGRHRFLLAGDAEAGVEERLVENGLGGPFDLLKVGHHGSRTSTTNAFLDQVRPALALISCGRQNGFRHPNGKVLARLRDRGSQVLRTDINGLVTVRSNGRYLEAELFH